MDEDELDDFEDADYYVVIDKKNNINILEIKATKEITEIDQVTLDWLKSCKTKTTKQKNEEKRHWEQSEVYEITMVIRALVKPLGVDEEVEKKMLEEEVRKSLLLLPEIQRRRIIKYFYEDKKQHEIAKEEGTTQQSINYTLSIAKRNLKEFLKKFKN